MMVCLDTPQSILDETERDVFAEIFADELYADDKADALWVKYRFVGIAAYDIDFWIQAMKDVSAQLRDQWDIKIKAWKDVKASTQGDFDRGDITTETIVRVTELPDMENPSTGEPNYISGFTKNTGKTKDNSGTKWEKLAEMDSLIPDVMTDYANQFMGMFSVIL